MTAMLPLKLASPARCHAMDDPIAPPPTMMISAKLGPPGAWFDQRSKKAVYFIVYALKSCIIMASSNTADKSPWNSLEIAKFAVSVIAPFMLAVCGYFIWDAQRMIVERGEVVLREERKVADARAK